MRTCARHGRPCAGRSGRLLGMALHAVDGLPGPPWGRPLHGALDELVVESEALRDNPLGDPPRRPLYVYRAPEVLSGDAQDVPAVFVIQGFTGQADMWLGRSAFEPTMVERIDALFAGRECPPAVVVFVDAWTSRGGSQFLNSPSTGQYLDYLCDEVVPFVEERYPVARRSRSPGPGREVVGRLRRHGRADAPPRRVRRAGLARRRRPLRVQLPPRVPEHRADSARPLRFLLRGLSRAPGRGRDVRLGQVRQAV